MDKQTATEFEKLTQRIAQLEAKVEACEKRADEAERLAGESLRLVERASALLVEHITTFDNRVAEASDIIISRVTKEIPHLMLG